MASDGRYFDHLVAEQGDFDPLEQAGWEALKKAFIALADVHTGSILDIGAGTGHSRQLYTEGDSGFFVGLDLSSRALSVAARRFPTSSWVNADAGLLPFKDNSFELVAFSSILHHSRDPEALLRDAQRVLVPGGSVFAFDPSVRNPAMALFRHPRSPFYRSDGVTPDEKPMRSGPLSRMFHTAGFEEIHQVSKGGIPYKQVAPRWLNRGLAIYNAFDRCLAASRFDRWIGPFVITSARKPAAALGDRSRQGD